MKGSSSPQSREHQPRKSLQALPVDHESIVFDASNRGQDLGPGRTDKSPVRSDSPDETPESRRPQRSQSHSHVAQPPLPSNSNNPAKLPMGGILNRQTSSVKCMALVVCVSTAGRRSSSEFSPTQIAHGEISNSECPVIATLIGSTTTDTGLEVHAWLDESTYEKSKNVTDAQLEEVTIKRDKFHGEWNYQILPVS